MFALSSTLPSTCVNGPQANVVAALWAYYDVFDADCCSRVTGYTGRHCDLILEDRNGRRTCLVIETKPVSQQKIGDQLSGCFDILYRLRCSYQCIIPCFIGKRDPYILRAKTSPKVRGNAVIIANNAAQLLVKLERIGFIRV